jgi:hypothetical protein
MMLRVRFRFRYRRPAIPVLLLGTLVLPILILITRSLIPVAAAPQVEPNTLLGVRQFYLSRTPVQGNAALSACANGYHFASLWEIADPSNLRYNRSLGFTRDDSGSGPPSGVFPGWVRTGYSSSNSSTAGEGNCNGWTSQSFDDYGTAALLHSSWTAGGEDIGVWSVIVQRCDVAYRVWCIEDAAMERVYLPLVLR